MLVSAENDYYSQCINKKPPANAGGYNGLTDILISAALCYDELLQSYFHAQW